MPAPDEHRRTRAILGMAALCWVVAIVALIIGMRTRVKPVLIVGLLSGVLALVVTQVWLRPGKPRG